MQITLNHQNGLKLKTLPLMQKRNNNECFKYNIMAALHLDEIPIVQFNQGDRGGGRGERDCNENIEKNFLKNI